MGTVAARNIWVDRAEARILEELRKRVAVVWPEVEAVVAEPFGTAASGINPHHLRTAQGKLMRTGEIISTDKTTRGGRTVATYSLTELQVSSREWQKVSARKRLLYGRYLGWATGTSTKQGVIGPALERAVHLSLLEASPHVGYRVVNPHGGETSRVEDVELGPTYGALDNAAVFSEFVAGKHKQYVVPIEAKNVRDWIYPWSSELYQLLAKSAFLSAHFSEATVIPVLVCRRPHKTLLVMAKDCGFHVVDVLRQVINIGGLGDPEAERKLQEVRAELRFLDMISFEGSEQRIVRQFIYTIPKVAEARAIRWAQVGCHFEGLYKELQNSNLPFRIRSTTLNRLREQTSELGGDGGW